MAKMIQVPFKTKRYFTNDDNANLMYFQFPKLLMYSRSYKKMSAEGKLFYMICVDLIKLSMKENWKDEHGRYYIKMSLETIKERMNCQNTKAVNLKKELVKYELMDIERVGQGKADRLYILQLDYTDEDIYKANNDHEDIKNDELPSSENVGTLEPQENSENQSSSNPQIGELELCKSETIKNLITKTYIINKDLDDDIERTSPSGEGSAIYDAEYIDLIISNFREETKEELSGRSFKAVILKVMNKYSQGKVANLQDYLATSLINKITELELRRQKDNANKQIKLNPSKLRNLEVKEKIPHYDWLGQNDDKKAEPLNKEDIMLKILESRKSKNDA